MYSVNIWDELSESDKDHFNTWVEWFFSTLESANFTSGWYSPCDRWWEHPEALSRLVALWHSYAALMTPEVDEDGQITDEDSQKVADGYLSWWKEVDHHKHVLFSGSTSPFSPCGGGVHQKTRTAVQTVWSGALIPQVPYDFGRDVE